jgi:predicted SAM-dependent methyltransferase
MKKILILLLALAVHTAPAQKQLLIKNNLDRPIKEYMLEIPIARLALPLGIYHAGIHGEQVPLELSEALNGEQTALLPVAFLAAGEELTVTIEPGRADNYPKRTHAELSHKTGGAFEGARYTGGFSWVNVHQITLPGSFRDHAYYLRYEGPGWESDKTAFRLYLDNRNAIDVFGKRVKEIVLPAVGIDNYDSYHALTHWGMDNLKVENSLGLGSIAVWNGTKALRLEKRDSTLCQIIADGKLRSAIRTTYHGCDANGTKCNLTSLITIDAGHRASHLQIQTDTPLDNISTGLIKIAGAQRITAPKDATGEWTYIATFGQQSLNNDMQGLALFFRTRQLKQLTEDALNHVVVLQPENNSVDYYLMPTWQLDNDPVTTREQFMHCIHEVLDRLNHPVGITYLTPASPLR